MTNEQRLRLEILELRLAMAALERIAARQQQTINLLREHAALESIECCKIFDRMIRMVEIVYIARNKNTNVEST